MRTIIFTFVLLACATTLAQPASDALSRSKEHYRRGTQLYDLGRYLDAAKEYEEAFTLSDRAPFLFNIGQAYRLGGRPHEAIAAYRGFLRRVPDAANRSETEQYISELEQTISKKEEAGNRSQTPASPTATPSTGAKPPLQMLTVKPENQAQLAVSATPVMHRQPVAKKWWFWTVLVGAAAVAAAGVAVGVTQAHPQEPSFQVHAP
jgi:tetratricopeptide (TPR) repeat protein